MLTTQDLCMTIERNISISFMVMLQQMKLLVLIGPDSSPIIAGGWGELDYINIDSTAYYYDGDVDDSNTNIISDT